MPGSNKSVYLWIPDPASNWCVFPVSNHLHASHAWRKGHSECNHVSDPVDKNSTQSHSITKSKRTSSQQHFGFCSMRMLSSPHSSINPHAQASKTK